MNKSLIITPILMLLNVHFLGAEGGAERYEGLAGSQLATQIREDFFPKTTPGALPVGGIIPNDWPDGWCPEEWPGKGVRIGLVVPEEWTKTPVYDLYNLIGSDDDFEYFRSSFPPGELDEIVQENDGWSTGYGEIWGYMTNLWQPAMDRRGDLARRLMYMAVMYPQTQWRDRGALLFTDNGWPLLTSYGKDLLGKWNADDPIDDRERAELDAIFAAQGNANPIIEIPDLFDYLWGEKAGEAYVPDGKRERNPLRGIYSKSSDEFIDLYSPYVGTGASWMLDGSPVAGDTIPLSDITVGSHILSYTLGSERGKLKITVKP